MTPSPEPTRLTIELEHGDGAPRGSLLSEALEHPQRFAGWLELVSYIDAIRTRRIELAPVDAPPPDPPAAGEMHP